jgi:hypothetical protein
MDNNEATNKCLVGQSDNVSLRQGYNFLFEDNQHQIRVHGSAVSGKERVYVDHDMVAEKRSFGRRSSLFFTIDNVKYEAEFYVANLLTAETHCTLIKEGTHVATLKKSYAKSGKSIAKAFLTYFLCGAIAGFAGVTLFLMLIGE